MYGHFPNRFQGSIGENLVEKRDVVLGFSEEDRVEILEGIQEGEDVVTVGYEGLADGYAVNIISWEGIPPPEEPSVSVSSEPASFPEKGGRADEISPPQGRDTPPRQQARRRSPGSRGPGGREMPPEMVDRLVDRLMESAEAKEEYEARLARDPELATDFEKKRAFVQEMMRQDRGDFRRQ